MSSKKPRLRDYPPILHRVMIDVTDNGYVISHIDPGEDAVQDSARVVQEKDNDPNGQQFALQQALWEVIDMLGMYGSKHEPRVRVVVQDTEGKELRQNT